MRLLHIFLNGYVILILAIFINLLIKSYGLFTWYDLLSIKDFNKITPVNLLFLLVIYPFVLGLGVYIVDRILKK